MRLPHVRFTVQRMMVAVVAAGTFLAWLHMLEMRRVAFYREVASKLAEDAVEHPFLMQHSRAAASLAHPWASGWPDTLGFAIISFFTIGLVLWVGYRAVRFVGRPYRGRPGSHKPTNEPEVRIRLTAAEAVVLDDLLRRYSETGERLSVGDGAEQQVLWNLLCLLEREGDRPSWPSLSEARSALADSD